MTWQPMQPYHDNLIQLSRHVWIYPHDPDSSRSRPNVGIVCTPTQTLLIDAGNSPAHARRIQGALYRLGAPRVSRIIYTHHHWDHVFGACVFSPPLVIAHEKCRDKLVQDAAHGWGPDFTQRAVQTNPRLHTRLTSLQRALGADWHELTILVPNVTFAHQLCLYLQDGLWLELTYVGGQHADDSVIVRVHDDHDVLFLGDCFYAPPAHETGPDATTDWPLLRSLLDESIGYYVDGHAPPSPHAELLAQMARLRAE